MTKIVHAADIHLDSPMCGLSRYEGAPVSRIRGATRRALENLVALCLEERASLLLVAGDLYDGSWKDYATGLYFASQMSRLREAGVRVIMVRGNHDAESRIARTLTMPDNVVTLSAKSPETLHLEDLGVAVHGQSFPDRAVTDDLAARYPDRSPGFVNVGLLHTAAEGREGHARYAPCTRATLEGKGYDYWALGHVHRREVLSSEPWIVFPGNLQGRHVKETGAKGATLITLDGGRVASVEARTLDAVRWAHASVDATEASAAFDVVDLARSAVVREVTSADGRPVAVRVHVAGASRAHGQLATAPERWINEVRQAANDACGDAVWVADVKLATLPEVDASVLAAREDAVGQLCRALAGLRSDDGARAELFAELAELARRLPPEVRGAGRALDDPEVQRALLDDATASLLPRLLSREDA